MVLSVGSSESSMQFAVQAVFRRLSESSVRLATLQRIQRGSDDPAGLIASEQLSAEIAAIHAASRSADRSRALTQTADRALGNATGLLNKISSSLVAAANRGTLSEDEQAALQFEVDAALDAFNQIGKTTIGGKPVFGRTIEFTGTTPSAPVSVTLPAVDESLGGDQGMLADLRSGGSASILGGQLTDGELIVEDVRSQLMSARAQLGAFEESVNDTTRRVMEQMEVNLTAARSAIRDTNIAQESSRQVREQILSQAALLAAKLSMHSQRTAAGLLQ